jgi:hypothetical protein
MNRILKNILIASVLAVTNTFLLACIDSYIVLHFGSSFYPNPKHVLYSEILCIHENVNNTLIFYRTYIYPCMNIYAYSFVTFTNL